MAMDVFGLLGNPVGHSLSPPMHEAAYDELGLDARYVTFEPAPDDIEAAIDGADTLGITGLNVTIPFKRDALEIVEPDELAARIGAVNTIDFSGGARRPVTTPMQWARCARYGITTSPSRVHTPSSSAQAALAGRSRSGWPTRVRRFRSPTGPSRPPTTSRTTFPTHGYGLDELEALIADADVLVNATSVGMEEDATPVPADALHGDLAVMDAVYRPLETRLLSDAAAAGATTVDGAWMLLYQGRGARVVDRGGRAGRGDERGVAVEPVALESATSATAGPTATGRTHDRVVCGENPSESGV